MAALHRRSQEVAKWEARYRRKAFWIASSLNRLFSVEYGRSVIQPDSITCPPFEEEGDSDLTADFVKLCQLLPKNHYDARRRTEEGQCLSSALEHLADVIPRKPPLALLVADVCFSIFRKMRFIHLALTRPQTEVFLNTIRDGLVEAQSLSRTSSKWWNIVSVPFHSVCVLIAIDSAASLGLLATAMETLKVVVGAYDTHLAREALQTAEQLLRKYQEKKMEEATRIGQAVMVMAKSEAPSHEEEDTRPSSAIPRGFDWPSDDDGGWMEVFFNMEVEQ